VAATKDESTAKVGCDGMPGSIGVDVSVERLDSAGSAGSTWLSEDEGASLSRMAGSVSGVLAATGLK